MYLTKQQNWELTHMNLEILKQREQLMEDIDCIITDYFAQFDVNYDEELVKILCDAVCKNFPLES